MNVVEFWWVFGAVLGVVLEVNMVEFWWVLGSCFGGECG